LDDYMTEIADVPQAPSGDPVDVLLYCCGRAALGELPQQTEWQWDGRVRT
jgi:hypothetical protein